MQRKAKKILFYIFIAYICVVGGLYFGQRSMIYFPPEKGVMGFKSIPDPSFLPLKMKTEKGLHLNAWYKKAQENKDTMVFFHGNASSHEENASFARSYIEDGYGFLSVGYPGYNGNDGKPSEQGFYDSARSYISLFIAHMGVPEDRVILHGQSIGTGVAVQMATEYPDVKAVVLVSPYTSLPDVAAKRYFFIPVKLLMKDKFDSLSKIKDVKAPLLIMYGSEDNLIPPTLSKRLFEAANEPKKIVEITGYGHNDMPIETLSSETVNFLEGL